MTVKTAACGHVIPAFGCLCCIAKDHDAWVQRTISEWKAKFKLPKCKKCKRVMFVYEPWNVKKDSIEMIVACPSHDGEGMPTCPDVFVTIP